MTQRGKFICLMLMCIALLSGSVGTWAEGAVEGSEPYVWGDFTYCLDADGGACILEYTGSDSSLSIPQEMDGHPVRSIGEKAFYECDSLTEVELPEGLTAIGKNAFSVCISLKKIELPESLASIGYGAFSSCRSMERFVVSPENAHFAAIDGVLYEKTTKTLLAYPRGRQDAAFAVPEGISVIGDYAFPYCNFLTEVELPESLTTIGQGAFAACGLLRKIELPEGLTTIGTDAFLGCKSLTEIEFPEGLTNIGDHAFILCESLTKIKLPESLTTIGDGAFDNCESLTLVVEKGSYAQQWAKESGIPYTYPDSMDWLQG